MAAAGAERRDRAFVVAPGQADRVLLQRRVVDLGFRDVGHAAFSSFAFTPAITWCALIGKPAVVAHRLELLDRHAGLEHQQAAQLRVAVLLDDEVDLVRVEERRDLVAEREAAHAHVVDGDAVLAPAGRAPRRRRRGSRRR